MNIAQAQQEIRRLWGLYQAGQLSPEAYTLAVNGLQITDESGGFWHVDGATQKWYQYAGQAWVEANPPSAAAVPPPPPAAPWPPAPPPPPLGQVETLSPPRSRLPLWIGLGVALVAIAVVMGLLLGGAFSGGPKAALPPTATQAQATFTNVPAVTVALPASPVPPATRTPAPTKALAVPPSPTLPLVSSPTPKPSATKAPQQPTSTPINPADLLNPQGPWLLSRDADNVYLIQAKRVDSLNTERVVAPSSLADMISPSGGRVAYITTSDPEGLRGLHLNIYNLAQRQVEKVIALTSAKTDPPAGAMPGDPSVEAVRSITDLTSIAWSPDGRTLAFIGFQDGPSSDLYSYSLDSGKILHLTDGPSQAYGPSWSPDGKYIVQFGVTVFGTGAGYTMAGAWAVHADDSGVISLYTPTSNGETALGWIDANTILVYGFNPVCGNNGLRAVAIQPVKVTTILPGCFTNVAFDPSSHTIALAIDQITSEGPGQHPAGLYLLKLDGTLVSLAAGDMSMPSLPAKTGTVWGYVANKGYVAFTTAGAAITLPSGVTQEVPNPAPGAKTWAWYNGQVDNTPGLWIGPLTGSPNKVYNGSLSAAAWSPTGILTFMSGTTLYFAPAPSYQPVSYGDIFPATGLAWVRP